MARLHEPRAERQVAALCERDADSAHRSGRWNPAERSHRQQLQAGGTPYVFGGAEPWSRTIVERARRRLVAEFGAPEFTWSQTQGKKASLRATCGTYLTNSCIYASASPFHSAKRLGHSVTIAERHYVGTLRGLPKTARTLEAVLEVRKEIDEIVSRMTGRKSQPQARRRKGAIALTGT